MNLYEYVRDLNISIDETKRLNCPICNGIKTFTVTNSMGTRLWNCYKASCDARGKARVHMSMEDMRKIIDSRNGATAKQELFELPDYITKRDDKHTMYDVKEDRIVYLIYNRKGILVDAVGKSINLRRIPKWKRYGKSNTPYSHGNGDIAIVVEDCISAYVVGKVQENCTGVALLGTSLLEGHREFLSRFNKVLIALDPDALPKTLQIAKELRGWVEKIKVLKLNDDLKYRDRTDINNLKELVWN